MESINGVSNDWSRNRYWIWWCWRSGEGWVEGGTAADLETVTGGIYCWSYSLCEPPSYRPSRPSLEVFSVGGSGG